MLQLDTITHDHFCFPKKETLLYIPMRLEVQIPSPRIFSLSLFFSQLVFLRMRRLGILQKLGQVVDEA